MPTRLPNRTARLVVRRNYIKHKPNEKKRKERNVLNDSLKKRRLSANAKSFGFPPLPTHRS